MCDRPPGLSSPAASRRASPRAAPVSAVKRRLRSLRLAAWWGRMAGAPSGSGRLAIGLLVARATLKRRLRSLRLAALSYNPSHSSRAATILWGRLATCGRLAIGLPVARATLDQRLRSLRLAAMWGRLATCGRLAIGLLVEPAPPEECQCRLWLAAMWGGLIGLTRSGGSNPGRRIDNPPQVDNLPHKRQHKPLHKRLDTRLEVLA